ncbi:MAG: cytochrome P450 [Solirubrobacterales bacterium]|nr:cytochrome P450 [Solirubrobacterales bacterium]
MPPGPRYPRLIQTLGWATRGGPFLERCRARYGDMFTLRIAQEGNWVMLADPELVKQVFTGDPAVYHAGEGNEILLPVVGPNSVLLLDDQPHMRQRKLLLPPFHGERMQRYGEIMDRAAREEIERWPFDEPFELLPRMQAVTLEVILKAVFGFVEGARLEEMRVRLRRMLKHSTDASTWALLALIGPHRAARLPIVRRQIAPVDELIAEEIAERRSQGDLSERDDILSLLLAARHEDGSPMSDDELRDELVTLLVAGHETTATALSWSLERLVRHPEKLDRLRAEVAAGEEDDYLDAVIKETLRVRPVLHVVVRKLTEAVELGGHTLPAGTRVVPCIHLVHRRDDLYPDPHAFRPERFLGVSPGTYNWIPFGGGVRRCLGASFALFEMKRVLGAVVMSVELEPAEPSFEPARRRAITLTPSRGASVVVRPGAEPAGAGSSLAAAQA